MINIKGKQNYLVALESVAMTDIVMNMFIFFFISFSLIYTFNPQKMSKIDVRLPKASSAVKLEGPEKAILSITRAGEYYLGEDKVAPKALKAALEAKLKLDPGFSLLLNVDASAKFSSVSAALDAINELGIQKVSVATLKK
jgi:biopolymer transport protein ExbD